MFTSHQLAQIESGRQIGISSRIHWQGEPAWICLGIQKRAARYIAHIDLILERYMDAEHFALDETLAFDSLGLASAWLERHCHNHTLPTDFKTSKGHRFFNPQLLSD